MAENVEQKTTKGSTGGSNITEGAGVTAGSTSDAVKTVGGGQAVNAPLDAKPGEPQGGDLGQPDDQQEGEQVQAQTEKGAGYPLKVTKKGHEHNGRPVAVGATIMLDVAEYRWALTNNVGMPGDAAHVGKDVDKKGEVIPDADEVDLAELERKATEKHSKK